MANLVSALLLACCAAGALACGSTAAGDDAARACSADMPCGAAEVCEGGACVAASGAGAMGSTSAEQGCSVLRCRPGEGACCEHVAFSATEGDARDFASRVELLTEARTSQGEVRASFSFDAEDQQGWIKFALDGERELSRMEFTGRLEGAADRFLSVSTEQLDGSGCSFGLELEAQPSASGAPVVLGNGVELNQDDFCYGGARPGRAAEFGFTIFSTAPGAAALTITSVVLTLD